MDIDSDIEADDPKHKRLLDNVLNLNTRQYVNKPTRTEPTVQISEYNLVKSLKDNKDAVRLHNLTKPLQKRAVDVELRKKVKKAAVKSKTLAKPLEKPQAERIRRSTAYESTKTQLDRWEPVVTSNRISTNLSFPLRDPNFDYKEARDFTSHWVVKSNLEKELEKLEPKTEVIEVETESLPKLTLKEMMAKRKELAKLRRYQSYKEIKARWQNKIKSKKFRKIQRKERIKNQMKEFKSLQKTNPEEALKKLDEIEKARAEERASLRHKSTGKWARNQQIRAKYDKESRKVLAEQLAVSKDLMQKQQLDQSSESADEDSDENLIPTQDDENVWTNKIRPSEEIQNFVSDYKKYCESQNTDNSKKTEIHLSTENNFNNSEDMKEIKDKEIDKNILKEQEAPTENILSVKKKKRKLKNKIEKRGGNVKLSSQKKTELKKRRNLQVDTASAVWEVTSLDLNSDTILDDVFDNIEYKMQDKINNKLKEIQSKLEGNSNISNKKKKLRSKDTGKKRKTKSAQPDFIVEHSNKLLPSNVELPNKIENTIDNVTNKSLESLKSVLESQPRKVNKTSKNIKSEKILNSKLADFNSSIPDIISYEDNEEMTDGTGIITEAFEDTDIIEEFAQDKKEEIDKERPKDLDLVLPGWGSWGGKDLAIPKKKKKRFIMKAPKQFPRKDMNQGNLIINESANDNIKSHLVSEVPFPFKTVKDFEASVRAPIGNTFVPETAFRKMIQPALRTKMGAIIEPITEDILLHKQKKRKVKT